jgi:uncharacterized protein YfaS (alpha-2-macroglobulin family)
MVSKLVQYIDDNTLQKDLFAIYARGYWKEMYPVATSVQDSIIHFIKQEWQQIERIGLYRQALLIIATMTWIDQKDDVYAKAIKQLENIHQMAIEDTIHGIRWKNLADADDLNNCDEETIALLAEAFARSTAYPQIRDGIVKWLLSARTDHHWKNTKSTAAAINLLQEAQTTATGATRTISATINKPVMTVTDDLLKGQLFSFVKTTSVPPALPIHNLDTTLANGDIILYYFTSITQLNQLNKDIQLSKTISRFNESSQHWESVDNNTMLTTGEKLKVVLTIETPRPLQYVFIDDKAGGALESTDVHSGYESGNGFSYYRSVRDAGQQFFSDFIPSGRLEIVYELKTTQEGVFTNGPASLQCMYKPAIMAYSNSTMINVNTHD